MSTDYTKSFRFWRLTFSVSLPGWMRSIPTWLYHPVATYQELQRVKRQAALEAKWEKLFTDMFSSKKPEFEFDEKKPGRVLGLKEDPREVKLPSVGVWESSHNKGALDRAVHSAGMKVDFSPAPEALVEERRLKVDKIRDEIWEDERKAVAKRRSRKKK